MNVLNELLQTNVVKNDLRADFRDNYRKGIEDILAGVYDTKVNFRYGGSLAKGTANLNSCDIDLLAYLDSDSNLSVETIFNITLETLKKNYVCERKNSAIRLTGDKNGLWEYSVDVVPGKYSSGENEDEVYLWRSETKSRIKTNPESQIGFVKDSKSKDVIRLIKIYRELNNFAFKSFFLEVFAISVVENDHKKENDIYDKLVNFCSRYKDIGVIKIYDPANPHNNIMDIHSEYEFEIIREKMKLLYEALLTDNNEAVRSCFNNEHYDIEKAYFDNLKTKPLLKNEIKQITINTVSIKGFIVKGREKCEFSSYDTLAKGEQLEFELFVPPFLKIKKVQWFVANSGYEARSKGELRGDKLVDSDNEDEKKVKEGYKKIEKTAYYGNHFVQAVCKTTDGMTLYSNILTVKIR